MGSIFSIGIIGVLASEKHSERFCGENKVREQPDISSRLEREGGNGELGQWARLGCGRL